MSTKNLILSYYDSLNKKDDKWKELYAHDAYFADASHVLIANGKEEVVQSFITFLTGMESVQVKDMIAEDKNACAIVHYVYVNPKGKKMEQDVAEVWRVEDDKLAKLIIYFDLTAYRTFMRS